MKQELQDQLFAKYPEIFVQRTWDMMQTCMCWGIDCGDGWYDIIDRLCDRIMMFARQESIAIPQAVQVKEKFGALRFYLNGYDERLSILVAAACESSRHTCENCGKPGKSNEKGWITTLCDPCRQTWNSRFDSVLKDDK